MILFDLLTYACDAPAFAKNVIGFDPDPVQHRLLATTPSRCILNCSRQWGKSTLTAIKALHHAIFNAGSLTIVLSPSQRQSNEFLRKIEHFTRKAGFKPRGDGKNSISLRLPNQSRIIGLPANEDTIRGFSAPSFVLIDEAARVPDDLYKAVRPMLATSNGALWLISTPNGKSGFFYDTWHAIDSPTERWTRIAVPATECPRIGADFLENERASSGEFAFRQEYLCEFHDSDDQLVSREQLQRARSIEIQPLEVPPVLPLSAPPQQVCVYPEQPPEEPVPPDEVIQSKLYLGLDFGQTHDYTALAILEKSWVLTGPRNHTDYERKCDERFAVRHLERFPLLTSYTDVVARVGQLVRSIGGVGKVWVTADATGVGSPIVEMIRNLQLGCMLHGVNITPGDSESVNGLFHNVPKSKLIDPLILQFESNRLKVAANLKLADTLLEELANLRVKVTKARNEIYANWRTDVHDDLLFAVALANWRAQKDKWYAPHGRLF